MRGTSLGDYGKAGRATSKQKAYMTVGTDHPEFFN
jgi:hypothetical protein